VINIGERLSDAEPMPAIRVDTDGGR